MAQKNLALVTGANGHLGNNLVRLLLDKGIPVRAGVRNVNNKTPFEGLDCELAQVDITDKNSLIKALAGVETFYAVGAAFKLWSRKPVTEIYDVNLSGARNTVEAAAEAGVKRIVYVSSVATLDFSTNPTKESNGYNTYRRDWYFNSKIDGEQLVLELARQHGIELVAVLPSVMIGSQAFGNLNVSYNVIRLILNKKVPVETNIKVNWVDVKDVAEGCYRAALHGRAGERYILANEKSMSIREVTRLAQMRYPQRNIKLPIELPKPLLLAAAWCMELAAIVTGRPPLLTTKEIEIFAGAEQDFDISKSRAELGFNPKAPAIAVQEAMDYLMQESKRLGIKK